jgi:hypothetical protein
MIVTESPETAAGEAAFMRTRAEIICDLSLTADEAIVLAEHQCVERTTDDPQGARVWRFVDGSQLVVRLGGFWAETAEDRERESD